MKILLVGDLHVKKDNIKESGKILDWIIKEAQINKVDSVMLLGDQYNDFASIRVEVMTFWKEQFDKFNTEKLPILAIDGNHDMSTDCFYSAMKAHEGTVLCTNRSPVNISSGLWMIPFYRNNKDFLKAVHDIASSGYQDQQTVFCHQEFDGAVFENGFYAPHGIQISDLPKNIDFISGHIHKKQEFGPVWYPGTARCLTRSDAGETKGIHILDTDSNKREFIPTPEGVSEPFRSFKFHEGGVDATSCVPDSSRTYVDLKGSKKYIKKMLKTLPQNIIVRTFVEDGESSVEIKESDGIANSFKKYSKRFYQENDLSQETQTRLEKMVFEKCPILKTQ